MSWVVEWYGTIVEISWNLMPVIMCIGICAAASGTSVNRAVKTTQ